MVSILEKRKQQHGDSVDFSDSLAAIQRADILLAVRYDNRVLLILVEFSDLESATVMHYQALAQKYVPDSER
jgi:hypothetical protein